MHSQFTRGTLCALVAGATLALAAAPAPAAPFELVEARISDIQTRAARRRDHHRRARRALSDAHQGLQRHLRERSRRAFSGPSRTIAERGPDQRADHAQPAARRAQAWGFDDAQGAQHDRCGSTPIPNMPDALEVARRAGREFSRRRASSPARCTAWCIAIKDQYDTFDMRTTSGADAFYANDRPPRRRDLRQAAARRRRDHPRQGQHGRVRRRRAQLVRRHALQSLRHRAQPGRLERRLRLGGRGQSGDLRHRRGVRPVDPQPRARTTTWSASRRRRSW